MAERLAHKGRRATGAGAWVVLLVVLALTGASLVMTALSRLPLSVIDEHTHLDYALMFHEGEVPYRGSLYSEGVLEEWACGVGHEIGPLPAACDSPDLTAEVMPPGRYSTGYIHYPTYFAGAEAFRAVLGAVTGGEHAPVTVYRLFSVACLLTGTVAGVVLARRLGLRGSRLVAAAVVPIAAPLVLFLGVVVNPAALTVLNGVLVAAAGIRWMQTGRGFVWLALASAFASLTAVTHSLPVGAFMLATLGALVAGWRGWRPAGPWRPRWWHLVVLTAIVLVPVAVWGRVIEARATVPEEALFAAYAPAGLSGIVNGFFFELGIPHAPWIDHNYFAPRGDLLLLTGALRSLAAGLPAWLGVLVVAGLVIVAVRMVPRAVAEPAATPGSHDVARSPVHAMAGTAPASPAASAAAHDDADTAVAAGGGEGTQGAVGTPGPVGTHEALERTGRARVLDPLHLLAVSALLTFLLYAPALRLSNILNFGMDHPVVSRYSIALMPLFTYLVLLALPGRALPRVLAAVGVTILVGCSVWWL